MISGNILTPSPGLTHLHHLVWNQYLMCLFNDLKICAHLWTCIVLIASSHLDWIFDVLILQFWNMCSFIGMCCPIKMDTLWIYLMNLQYVLLSWSVLSHIHHLVYSEYFMFDNIFSFVGLHQTIYTVRSRKNILNVYSEVVQAVCCHMVLVICQPPHLPCNL